MVEGRGIKEAHEVSWVKSKPRPLGHSARAVPTVLNSFSLLAFLIINVYYLAINHKEK